MKSAIGFVLCAAIVAAGCVAEDLTEDIDQADMPVDESDDPQSSELDPLAAPCLQVLDQDYYSNCSGGMCWETEFWHVKNNCATRKVTLNVRFYPDPPCVTIERGKSRWLTLSKSTSLFHVTTGPRYCK